jgi:hypothetical protein
MFDLQQFKTNKDGLDEVINELLAEMKTTSGETEEYSAMADQLAKLYPLKKHNTSKWVPSADQMAIVAGNLIGIMLIIHSEQVGVITSKALGFVIKPH